MRFTGTLKTWNDDRGFGFIEPAKGGEPLFVHIKDFPSGSGRPQPGQAVTFEVMTGSDGRKRALAVQYPPKSSPAARARVEPPARWTLPRLLALPAYAAVHVAVALTWGLAAPWLLALAALSVVTFGVYAFDKAAAQAGRWRTPEQTLHLLALAGGWPGALLAQQALRHKTRKRSFVAVFWLTVLLNTAGVVAWHAGAGPLAGWR